jgi:hypothetical protein
MSKQKGIFFLGIWVAILPFLGFPLSWKRTLALVSGAYIAYLGYLLNKERTAHDKHTPHTTYVENSGAHEQ